MINPKFSAMRKRRHPNVGCQPQNPNDFKRQWGKIRTDTAEEWEIAHFMVIMENRTRGH